jgi:general secretion pathway protein A
MFLQYYELREQPFGVTPDPRFLYFGSTHREAFASLLYAIELRRGFSAMVAEPGMGKTSLLFRMLELLGGSARTAFLFQTHGSRDLLTSVLRDLGIHPAKRDLISMHEALNAALLEEMRFGRQVVVVIDEAQNLDEKALESVRLLSNFETSAQKLMHIVLAGQPGLAERLASPELAQLRQRVSTIIRLERLTPEETSQYIEHRLRAAGHEGAPIFSGEALELIARVSQGIPRNINSLCFLALSMGFATQTRTIGADIAQEVAAEFELTAGPTHRLDRETGTRLTDSKPSRHIAPFRLPLLDTHRSSLKRSPRSRMLAMISACVAIPLLSIIALSDPGLRLSGTMPARISGKVLNALLASVGPDSDFVPTWPNRLKPPSAPSVEITSQTSSPAGLTGAASGFQEENESDEALDQRGRQQFDIVTSKQVSRDTALPEAANAVPAQNAALNVNRGFHRSSRRHEEPQGVRVLHTETVFQFAFEHYGKSTRTLVKEICEANPQIRGPYDILSPGQWIQLPDEPGTSRAGPQAVANRHSQ